jgi:hypothetical protein
MCYGLEKRIRSKRRNAGDSERIDHKTCRTAEAVRSTANGQIPFLQGIEDVNLFVSLRV